MENMKILLKEQDTIKIITSTFERESNRLSSNKKNVITENKMSINMLGSRLNTTKKRGVEI